MTFKSTQLYTIQTKVIFRLVSGFSYTEKSYLQTLIRPLYGFDFSNYHYENNIRN